MSMLGDIRGRLGVQSLCSKYLHAEIGSPEELVTIGQMGDHDTQDVAMLRVIEAAAANVEANKGRLDAAVAWDDAKDNGAYTQEAMFAFSLAYGNARVAEEETFFALCNVLAALTKESD